MKLVVPIKIEFELEDGKKEFKLRVRKLTKKDEKKFMKWAEKKEAEPKSKEYDALVKEFNPLKSELDTLRAELEDVSFEIANIDDKDEALELVKERRELRRKIRELEPKVKELSKKLEPFKEQLEEVANEVVMRAFKARVVEDEESKRLLEFVDEMGLELIEVLSIINTNANKAFKGK